MLFKAQPIDWVNATLNKVQLAIKIELSFDFYRVSDVPHLKFRVRLHTCISEMTLERAYWSMCAKQSEYGMCF